MGLTAETVQVHLGGLWPGNVRERLAEVIREFLAAQGYAETASEDEADRTLTVAPPGDRRWISVFDTEIGAGEKLAQQVSRSLGTAAASLMVYDSDDLFVRLYRVGKIEDRFERSGGRRKRKGDPARWSAIVGGAAEDAVRDAFAAESLFAEESLRRLAEAVGMDPDQCTTPSDHLDEITSRPDEDGFLQLHFRSKSAQGKPAEVEGPPLFAAPMHGTPELQLGVGEDLPGAIVAYVRNAGGATRGVRVELGGSALEDGLIELSELNIFSGARREEHRFALEPGRLSGEAPDFAVEAGMTMPADPVSLLSFFRRRPTERMIANTVSARLSGAVRRPGSGELGMSFVPLANPQGRAECVFRLRVRPQARVPRKANPKIPGKSVLLHMLESPRTLLAVASLRADAARSAAAARPAIQRWVEFIARARPEGWNCLFAGAPLSVPKQFKTRRSAELAAARKWTGWLDQMDRCAQLTAYAGEDRIEGMERFAGCAGCGYDGGSIYAQFSAHAPAPHLGFWLDTKVFADDEIEEAERLLAGFLDDLVAAGGAMQGFIARWRCGDLTAMPSTLYERACDVPGQCTNFEFWCTRYLRAVSDRIWLGPELLGRLTDRSVLDAVADITPIGAGARLVRKPGATLDDLEAALDPLLAGQQEWMTGMRQRYGMR